MYCRERSFFAAACRPLEALREFPPSPMASIPVVASWNLRRQREFFKEERARPLEIPRLELRSPGASLKRTSRAAALQPEAEPSFSLARSRRDGWSRLAILTIF
jgi:hypothetical protein